MLQNKAMRDRMLQDAKIKSENEQHRAILEDKALAEKLITQIEVEKRTKAIKKKEEREAAMKVIRDNQEEKKKRLKDEELRKDRENKEIEEMQRLEEEKIRKREQAIAERGARI